MMRRFLLYIYLLVAVGLSLCSIKAHAQTNESYRVSYTLDSLSKHVTGLNGIVELSVSDIRLDELLRALALTHNLNLSVEEDLSETVVGNFSDVQVKEVLIFLVKKYRLTIDYSGSILAISKHKKTQKALNINYNAATQLLSFDLRKDSLLSVAREITKHTSVNLVLSHFIQNETVSGYIKDLPINKAVEQLAQINNLVLREVEKNVLFLEKRTADEMKTNTQSKGRASSRKSGSLSMQIDSLTIVSLRAENASLHALIKDLFHRTGLDYVLYAELEGQITTRLQNTTIDRLLDQVLNASKYAYIKEEGVYYIGERLDEGIREVQMIQIQHRSCVALSELIPVELKKDLHIQELAELNALVVEGSGVSIKKVKDFILQVDQSVPVVMIEVLIVDYIKSNGLESGIEMGVAQDVVETSGELFPSINSVKGAESLNKLIDAFNGFGALNVGSVMPNFYMNIKAMEHNGVLDVKSTPVLTTLNGQEASLSIGNTEYYVVETNNIIGTQNPQSQTTRNWNSVKAELGVKIIPNVSADNHVTLNIEVKQSNFTARTEPDAPPGQVSRTFNSLIRVKNGDMILLGGLEEIKREDTGQGVPGLARVPIIKWFFSKRLKENSDKKLNIFIKPTIIN